MRLSKALLLAVGVVQALSSGAWDQGIDDRLHPFLSEKPANSKRWAEEGTRIYADGLNEADCQKLLQGYGLLLAANGHDSAVEVPSWEYDNCPRTGFYVPYYEGNRAFDLGEYSRAVLWYRRALESAIRPSERAKVKSNLGMCYYWDGDLEPALEWMVDATEEGLEHMSPNSLNNIAGLCIALGEFERALEYSMLAEERLMEEFKGGMDLATFAGYHDVILLGQMAAQLELGYPKDARDTYVRAHLDEFFPGLAPEFVHMGFLLAWEFNEPELIQMHAASFSNALMMDSLGAVERLGPVLALLPPWSQSFSGVSVWDQLRSLPFDQLPEFPARDWKGRTDVSGRPLSAMFLWSVIWCVTGALGLGIIWRRDRWKRDKIQEPQQGVIELRAGCAADANEAARGRALLALRAIESRWKGKVLQMDFSELNSREIDALRAAIVGERPKDSAERWGITTRAVYAARASLRGKLGIDKDTELETWINKHWTA